MVQLIACILFGRTASGASSFDGIWVDQDGDFAMLVDGDPWWGFKQGTTFRSISPRTVDNGGWFAYWRSTDRVRYLSPEGMGTPALLPAAPAASGKQGRLRVTLGPQDAYGVVHILNMRWLSDQGDMPLSGTFSYAGPISDAEIGGTYSSKTVRIHLRQATENDSTEVGTLSAFGHSYSLRLTPAFANLPVGTVLFNATITDRDDGDTIGSGQIEWTPTRKFAKKMLHGETGPVDRIQVGLVFPDYRNGDYELMTKQ